MRLQPGVGIFVGLIALSLANCSSTYRDECQKQIDCEGGNDKDVDACVSGLEGQENQAEAYDCGDKFDELYECLEGKSTCQNKSYNASTAACQTQLTAYGACIQSATGRKSGGTDL